ncbi:MAG: NrfD/PsrC family molybdoenzyme membrane anchor subunit [Janthinobacterium lividum]
MPSDMTADGPRFHGSRSGGDGQGTPEAHAAIHGGQDLAGIVFDHPLRLRWWLAMAGAMGLMGVLAIVLFYVLWFGVGMWGNNIPVTWALDIVGYDFWIGIACGSLALSAVLLLAGLPARSALGRLADTVAVLAAAAAGTYPIIHLGRPWYFYWNLPYPNTFLLWPQFRSPLYWDAIDILSFLGVAGGVWFLNVMPDLALLRDRATDRLRVMAARAAARGEEPDSDRGWKMALLRAQLYGIASLGWRGSATHWRRWSEASRILAVLSILVVLSLQTGAAVMFAGSLEPGWHDTLEPVSFVVVALLSGVGVVSMVAMVVRAAFGLEALITARHLELLAWAMLALGLVHIYCSAFEALGALNGDSFDRQALVRRVAGSHAWSFWSLVVLGLASVQLFWIPALRRSALVLAVVGGLVAVAMWSEHFMIIVTTLQHDFLPSVAQEYTMNIWGLATFAGSLGLLLTLLLLSLRYLPVLSILDVRRAETVWHAAAPSARPDPVVRRRDGGSLPAGAAPAGPNHV